MITLKINNRTYYISDIFPVSAWLKCRAVDGEEQLQGAVLLEMLRDENGNRYPNVDVLYDNVDVRDLNALCNAIFPEPASDPLAKMKDSATV